MAEQAVKEKEVKEETSTTSKKESFQDYINKLKHKYGVDSVVAITVRDKDNKEVTGYFKYPWFGELSGYYQTASQNASSNILKAPRMLLSSCFLDGDKQIIDSDKLALSAIQQLDSLFPKRDIKFEEVDSKSDGTRVFKVVDEQSNVFSFTEPDFEQTGIYLGKVESDPVTATLNVLQGCKQDGEDTVINDPFNILAIASHVDEIINVKASSAVKY